MKNKSKLSLKKKQARALKQLFKELKKSYLSEIKKVIQREFLFQTWLSNNHVYEENCTNVPTYTQLIQFSKKAHKKHLSTKHIDLCANNNDDYTAIKSNKTKDYVTPYESNKCSFIENSDDFIFPERILLTTTDDCSDSKTKSENLEKYKDFPTYICKRKID